MSDDAPDIFTGPDDARFQEFVLWCGGGPSNGGAAGRACRTLEALWQERDKYRQWVADCQSGMYINCVYCGHRYGPKGSHAAAVKDGLPMQEALRKHIEQCPEHPMSKLKAEVEALREALTMRRIADAGIGTEPIGIKRHAALRRVAEAAEACESPLAYASGAFNDDRFTDRHQMGPVFAEALSRLRTALAATKETKP